MVTAEIANRTAWITALLLGAQASLGLIRVRALSPADSSIRWAGAWILTGHTVIGLALPPLALVDGWFAMELPGIRGTSASGLWIATAALLLQGVRAVTGMTMLRLKEPQLIAGRRLHLAMAVLLVALAGAHVFLN